MVHVLPAPDPRALLPPILACLPTAFASPRPPPALFPLLSPILRQRVQHLAPTSTNSKGNWLTLLCWESEQASKLPGVVENGIFEPHPVSGEIELSDGNATRYRRLDEETLHARLEISDYDLLAVYLWCNADTAADGAGWRLAELRALEDIEDGTVWYDSITEADEQARSKAFSQAVGGLSPTAERTDGDVLQSHANGGAREEQEEEEEEDDGDYWAMYDKTPGRTPARTPAKGRSPAPAAMIGGQQNTTSRVQRPRSASEQEYFARYEQEVQPAMDAHDPDEAEGAASQAGESTLNGNVLSGGAQQQQQQQTKQQQQQQSQIPDPSISAPQPYSPSNSRSRSDTQRSVAEVLEQDASARSQAEMGVRQHIATDVKSLFRLARSVGIEREEFGEILAREVEVLKIIDV